MRRGVPRAARHLSIHGRLTVAVPPRAVAATSECAPNKMSLHIGMSLQSLPFSAGRACRAAAPLHMASLVLALLKMILPPAYAYLLQ